MEKQVIVIECVEGIECPNIRYGGTCKTFANPRAIQHCRGRLDACGVMPRPITTRKQEKVRVGQGKTKAGGNR